MQLTNIMNIAFFQGGFMLGLFQQSDDWEYKTAYKWTRLGRALEIGTARLWFILWSNWFVSFEN